jgi:hypothetical protein
MGNIIAGMSRTGIEYRRAEPQMLVDELEELRKATEDKAALA